MENISLSTLKNLNLLIIEDDQELNENLKTMTSIFFKDVYTALNGADALYIYQKQNIDVIMVDYVLPIMDGYEFTKLIRQKDNSIPIVMLSSHSDKEKLLNMMSLNLTEYIIKPINYTTLQDTLLKVIEKIEKDNGLSFKIDPTTIYNKSTKSITKEDETILQLTKSESDILELMIKNKNKIVDYAMIDSLFDTADVKSKGSLKNHIYKLRQKIGDGKILTIKDIGYILKIDE